MLYILSDILHSMGHSQYTMMYGIVGAWLSSPRTFIGSWSVWGFSALRYLSHCGMVSSHCGVKPSGLCVNFSTNIMSYCVMAL